MAKKRSFWKLVKLLVPRRFWIIIISIAVLSLLFNPLMDKEKFKEAYFPVLTSIFQGLTAFIAIIISLLGINRDTIPKKINEKTEFLRVYFYPLIIAIITVFSSLIGLVFFEILHSSSLIGQMLFINSSFAIWTILEILVLMLYSVMLKLQK